MVSIFKKSPIATMVCFPAWSRRPKLTPEVAKPEGDPPPAPGPAPSPTPQSKSDADIQAQILAELKALREQVKAVEVRLEAIEATRKER